MVSCKCGGYEGGGVTRKFDLSMIVYSATPKKESADSECRCEKRRVDRSCLESRSRSCKLCTSTFHARANRCQVADWPSTEYDIPASARACSASCAASFSFRFFVQCHRRSFGLRGAAAGAAAVGPSRIADIPNCARTSPCVDSASASSRELKRETVSGKVMISCPHVVTRDWPRTSPRTAEATHAAAV